MKSQLRCFPCFVKQALDVAAFSMQDEEMQEKLVRDVLAMLAVIDTNRTPPEIAYEIHCAVRQLTGSDKDAYRHLKKQSTELALAMLDDLRADVLASDHPLERACRYAIAGNIIDFGVALDPDYHYFEKIIRSASDQTMDAEWDAFTAALDAAENVLYLADNAGEIVLDRLLIEQIGPERVTFAVKSRPTLNDATMEDAREGGLCELVNVVETGSGIPGTFLDDCSEAFCALFARADVIISKGQANYETLSEKSGNIYYCLKVKCPAIGDHIGAKEGSLVIRKHQDRKG